MSNRLGYETIHTMVNLRREWKLKIKAEHINASKLINRLLGKYWEGEVCKQCLGSDLWVQTCPCGSPRIFCRSNNDICSPMLFCNCSWANITIDDRAAMIEQQTVLKGGYLAQYGPPTEAKSPTF